MRLLNLLFGHVLVAKAVVSGLLKVFVFKPNLSELMKKNYHN